MFKNFKQIKRKFRPKKEKPYVPDMRTKPGAVATLARRLAPRTPNVPLIRLGPAVDGGYVVPDDIDGVSACISPGVSTECGFDLALAERGIDIYMADASVDGPPLAHPRFHFAKKFLGPLTRGSDVNIAEFCNEIPNFAGGGDLILQMDIEGAEYPVLLGMSQQLLARFRIIILELHGLEMVGDMSGHAILQALTDKLLAQHTVVHVHPNNFGGTVVVQGIPVPRVLELTLLRNDRTTFTRDLARNFPDPLDAENAPFLPPLILPEAWR